MGIETSAFAYFHFALLCFDKSQSDQPISSAQPIKPTPHLPQVMEI